MALDKLPPPDDPKNRIRKPVSASEKVGQQGKIRAKGINVASNGAQDESVAAIEAISPDWETKLDIAERERQAETNPSVKEPQQVANAAVGIARFLQWAGKFIRKAPKTVSRAMPVLAPAVVQRLDKIAARAQELVNELQKVPRHTKALRHFDHDSYIKAAREIQRIMNEAVQMIARLRVDVAHRGTKQYQSAARRVRSLLRRLDSKDYYDYQSVKPNVEGHLQELEKLLAK